MGNVYKNLMGRYFALKISFLIFPETKKFTTESFLTFRELQPLVSYKRVSYKKKYVYLNSIRSSRCKCQKQSFNF